MPFTQAYAKKLAQMTAAKINQVAGAEVVKVHQVENHTWITGADYCIEVSFYRNINESGDDGIFIKNHLFENHPSIAGPLDFNGHILHDRKVAWEVARI